jgi:hypothetical protein
MGVKNAVPRNLLDSFLVSTGCNEAISGFANARELITHSRPFGNFMNALAIAFGMRSEDCVFVPGRHFVFLW